MQPTTVPTTHRSYLYGTTIADIKLNAIDPRIQNSVPCIKATAKFAGKFKNTHKQSSSSSVSILEHKFFAVIDVNLYGPNRYHRDERTLTVPSTKADPWKCSNPKCHSRASESGKFGNVPEGELRHCCWGADKESKPGVFSDSGSRQLALFQTRKFQRDNVFQWIRTFRQRTKRACCAEGLGAIMGKREGDGSWERMCVSVCVCECVWLGKWLYGRVEASAPRFARWIRKRVEVRPVCGTRIRILTETKEREQVLTWLQARYRSSIQGETRTSSTEESLSCTVEIVSKLAMLGVAALPGKKGW